MKESLAVLKKVFYLIFLTTPVVSFPPIKHLHNELVARVIDQLSIALYFLNYFYAVF